MAKTCLLIDCELGVTLCVLLREKDGMWIAEPPLAVPCAKDDPTERLLGFRHREQLAAALAERKWNRGDAIVVLPRAAIELKVVGLPPAPADDWPELARFGVLRDVPNLAEDAVLDFVPLPDSARAAAGTLPEGSEFHVHAAWAPPSLIESARELAKVAGLKLLHIVPRPFVAGRLLPEAVARLGGTLAEADGAGIGRLLAECHDEQIECSVFDGDVPILARSVRVPVRKAVAEGATEATEIDPAAAVRLLAAELRRTLAAGTQVLHGRTITEIFFVAGTPAERRLADAVETELGRPVRRIEPADFLPGAAGRSAPHPVSAAAAGTAHLAASGERPQVDFHDPRKRPIPPSKLRTYLLAGGAAAAILGGGWFTVHAGLADLDTQIKEKQAEIARLTAVDQRVSKYLVQQAQTDKWFAGEVIWLDVLARLSEAWKDPKEGMLLSLTAGPKEPGGELRFDAVARDSGVTSDLAHTARARGRQVTLSSGRAVSDKGPYRWRFEGAVQIPSASADDTLAVAAPVAAGTGQGTGPTGSTSSARTGTTSTAATGTASSIKPGTAPSGTASPATTTAVGTATQTATTGTATASVAPTSGTVASSSTVPTGTPTTTAVPTAVTTPAASAETTTAVVPASSTETTAAVSTEAGPAATPTTESARPGRPPFGRPEGTSPESRGPRRGSR